MQELEIRDFFHEVMSEYGLICGIKELNIDGLRIDIFAIDAMHNPFIIEFKKDKNRHIVGQSAHYLALVPTYKEQIQKKLNLSDINWNNLTVLCIAKEFKERDYKAAEFEPLNKRVHFYTFNIVHNTRNKIFSLNLDYKGPNKKTESPLKMPKKVSEIYDIKQALKEFSHIKKKEERREYYSTKILPLLKQIGSKLSEFSSIGMYPHYSYWDCSFTLRLGTDKTKSHRASVIIGFKEDCIYYGFDLTHALSEAQKLSKLFKDKKKLLAFLKKLKCLNLVDYYFYLPNTGIKTLLSIETISLKGFEILLKNYNPKTECDCYFRIDTEYEKESMNVNDAVKLIKQEYKKFKFIFDVLKE